MISMESISVRFQRRLRNEGLRGTVKWALRGALERGWYSFRLWLARLDDRLFDIRYGTDTGGVVPVSEYDVVGGNVGHGTGYQASRPRETRKVLKSLELPARSVLVDIGSGKGRVLMEAMRLGFQRIVGVEFIPELCEVAERNVERFRGKGRIGTPVEIRAIDCLDYEWRGDENVVYMNNPFDGDLMVALMAKIEGSISANPLKVWLVYMHPLFHSTIVGTGKFEEIARYDFPGVGRSFVVYVCDPGRFADAG
jgi:hypothetical protein